MVGPDNPISATFAWLGSVTDREQWVSAAAAVVTSAAAAILFADISVVRGVVGVVVLLLGALPGIAASVWRSEEERSNGNAVVEAQVLIQQALTPLADMAARIAQGAAHPESIGTQSYQHAVDSCLLPFKARRDVRAMLFLLEDNRHLPCVARSGRLGESSGFDPSTTRGKLALKVLEAGETVHVPDLAKERTKRKRAWSGSGRGYSTFITVPITVGDRGYGLLTVDAPEADTFGRTDVLFVELVAGILGCIRAELVRESEGG